MEEWTILEIQAKMSARELSAVHLVELYLERIEEIDKNGPCLNAVIEINPDAREIASSLDAERAGGKIRGLLHGVPLILKDNIDTADHMQTTAGSLALTGNYAHQDAFLVQRLRQAGAIILAKANLSEWANFRDSFSTSGWSSRGGLTRNPYALDRTACGSSSGSAAAVAANLCVAAIGTETDGSIICPAQTNGVVGIKPTVGLVSRSGVIPISHSQDTTGPITRTVTDTAILLGSLTGVDLGDPATQHSEGKSFKDYMPFLNPDGLHGIRIGVPRNLFGSDERIKNLMETNLEVLRQLGAELVDPADIKTKGKLSKSEIEVLQYEFKQDLNAYLSGLGSEVQVHSLADIIRFNEENQSTVMPYFGHNRMTAAQKKGPLTHKKYLSALAKNNRLARTEGIDLVLQEHKLDAFVCPSGGPAWMIDLVNGDASNWDMESTSLPAVAGYPHITVPAGYLFGLPVGISFFAGGWQEPVLIKIASAFEQATRVRQPPEFLPTVHLPH